MSKYLVFFALLALFTPLLSCKKPPTATTTPPPATTRPDELVELKLTPANFLYFNSKAKVYYKDPQNDINATVNIRMRKDSIIWMNITKVGVEAVRALITRDSVFVIDRINDDFYAYDFKSLSQKFNFDLNYNLLQAYILGDFPVTPAPGTKATVQGNLLVLRQHQEPIDIENFLLPGDQRLKKVVMTEKGKDNNLSIEYDNFVQLGNFTFPNTSALFLRYSSNNQAFSTLVNVEHNKPEVSDKELKFPFKIKPKYERK